MTIEFTPELENWIEAHHEIVALVEHAYENERGKVHQIAETEGKGGVWEFARDLTTEFENTHKDTNWDEAEDSWYDTIENFFYEKNSNE